MATTAWRDLAVDADGDLQIVAGDFVLLQGDAAITQECQTALSLFVGEYPFDVQFGADWPKLLSTKGITNAQVEAEIRRVLKTVQGVASVDAVKIARDEQTRAARIVCAVTSDSGATLTVPQVTLGA